MQLCVCGCVRAGGRARVVLCCVVLCCVVLCCVVLCCVVLCCVVLCCGVVWCGVVWCGVVWCGVVWCGVVWCGVVWCGVVWCGVVCVCVCLYHDRHVVANQACSFSRTQLCADNRHAINLLPNTRGLVVRLPITGRMQDCLHKEFVLKNKLLVNVAETVARRLLPTVRCFLVFKGGSPLRFGALRFGEPGTSSTISTVTFCI